MSSELKPCPFCGVNVTRRYGHPLADCHLTGEGIDNEDAWNRRVLPADVREALERGVELLACVGDGANPYSGQAARLYPHFTALLSAYPEAPEEEA